MIHCPRDADAVAIGGAAFEGPADMEVRLIGSSFEEPSDVTQRDFDLGAIGFEHDRELMEGLDQQFVVGRQ
jgi:hypothetical protein